MSKNNFVFNRRFLLYIPIGVIFLLVSLCFFKSNANEVALIFLGISLLVFAYQIFGEPLYFIFSIDEMTIVWLFQYKRTIRRGAITTIIKKIADRNILLPVYKIWFRFKRKSGVTEVMDINIPCNRRIKKELQRFAGSKMH